MTLHPIDAISTLHCAALGLNQTIESNLACHDELKLNLTERAFYVDDCLLSLNCLEEVSKIAKCLKDTLSRRCSSLTKFFSNVPGAIDAYPIAETMTMQLDQRPQNNK